MKKYKFKEKMTKIEKIKQVKLCKYY